MNRIGKKILFVAFVMFGFMMGVKAENETCTVEDKVRLRNLASMVSVNYELVDVYEEANSDITGFNVEELVPVKNLDVVVRNLNDDLYVIIDSPFLAKKIVADKTNKNDEGEIVIRKSKLSDVEKMTFTVYSYSKCTNDKLRVVNLTLPKVNPDSTIAMCQDIPEFYLCQPLITYDIKNVDYDKAIAEYKEKLANQENKPALENKGSNNNGVAGFVSKYKYLIVGFVVAVGIALTVIVLKRRGSVVR